MLLSYYYYASMMILSCHYHATTMLLLYDFMLRSYHVSQYISSYIILSYLYHITASYFILLHLTSCYFMWRCISSCYLHCYIMLLLFQHDAPIMLLSWYYHAATILLHVTSCYHLLPYFILPPVTSRDLVLVRATCIITMLF